MDEGDSDTSYAYYCFHKLHMLPSDFLKLERREKAVIIHFIDEKTAQEKEQQEKLENQKR